MNLRLNYAGTIYVVPVMSDDPKGEVRMTRRPTALIARVRQFLEGHAAECPQVLLLEMLEALGENEVATTPDDRVRADWGIA